MNYIFTTFTKIIKLVLAIAIICTLQNNNLVSQEQTADGYSVAIEDNSFLIEEAYNQEAGVVQHIFTGMQNFTPIKDWEFSFTQEWPMWGQTSQFSYTILYNSYNSGNVAGLGDLLLNYRYQLTGKGDFVAMSPRLSIIVPSGNKDEGLGMGTPGVQLNFPVSKRLSEDFAMHFNAGLTLYPDYKINLAGEEVSKSLTYYNVGTSIIWLVSSNLNFMLEALVVNNLSTFDSNADPVYFNEAIINPGFRYAINLESLQIVPGLAFPITFSEGETTSGMFLYLSLEHPF
jgi:hypothetical protein